MLVPLQEVWQDLKFLEQSLDSSQLRLRKKKIFKMSHLLVVTIRDHRNNKRSSNHSCSSNNSKGKDSKWLTMKQQKATTCFTVILTSSSVYPHSTITLLIISVLL